MNRKRSAALVALTVSLGITSGAQAAPDPQRVYVLGDSYTFDMQGQTYSAGRTLTQVLAERGWTSVISGRGGRGIGGTPTPNGLQQAVRDRAAIAQSSTVVVELGTNTSPDGRYFQSRALTLLRTIRGYQPAARILWVLPANFVRSNSYQSAIAFNRDVILNLPDVEPVRWDMDVIGLDVAWDWFTKRDAFKHPRADGPDLDKRADGYDDLKTLIADAVAETPTE